jgi:hypothetical protein
MEIKRISSSLWCDGHKQDLHHPEVLAGLPVPLHLRIPVPCGRNPDAALTGADGTHRAGAGRERILQVALKYSFQPERDMRLRAK